MKKNVKLNEVQLRKIIAESVKKVLNEHELWGRLSMEEYGKYFNKISDDLVASINHHPTLSEISCTKKMGWQWGEYNITIKLPLRNNFNSEEEVRRGVNELVGCISDSVMCNNYKVYGAFMENKYPSISPKQTITAEVKYIKSTNMLKIVVNIPYDVMDNLVNKTYPNVQLVSIDFLSN